MTPTRDQLSIRAATTLRRTLSTNLSFFAEAYKRKYGMPGPPLHDALTVAYISNPELFTGMSDFRSSLRLSPADLYALIDHFSYSISC